MSFIPFPTEFVDRYLENVKPSETALYLFLARRILNTERGRKDGGCALSLSLMVKRTGLSRRTVWTSLKALIDRNLIGREAGSGTNADFFRLLPIPASGANSIPLDDSQRCKIYTASGANSIPLVVQNLHPLKESLERKPFKEKGSATTHTNGSLVEVCGAFERWWVCWSGVRGSQRKIQAAAAWQRYVPAELESVALECTRSYLASLDDPRHGFYPDNFLKAQAVDGFTASWPDRARRKPGRSEESVRKTKELVMGRIARGERPI